jgi:hypothetical protein
VRCAESVLIWEMRALSSVVVVAAALMMLHEGSVLRWPGGIACYFADDVVAEMPGVVGQFEYGEFVFEVSEWCLLVYPRL